MHAGRQAGEAEDTPEEIRAMKGESRREDRLMEELGELRRRAAELEAREAERQEGEKTLRESEELYRILFEYSPTSLWLEDLSALKAYVDNLRTSGIQDLRGYFEKHPEALPRCASMVKLLDVNRITLALYEGRNKPNFPRDLSTFLNEGSYEAFKELIVSLAEGKGMKEVEATNRTLKGENMDIVLRWSILPGHEETWSKVLVSVINITERKRAEAELREYTERLRAMGSRMEEAQEAARKQIARVLHDQVGQNLTALGINLNILRNKLPAEWETRVIDRLDDSLSLLEETVQCIRVVMAELRPPALDEYGLVAALRSLGERYSKRTGTPTRIEDETLDTRLPASTETALFRIAQEALTNISKHAQATAVTIRVERSGETICLTIADNGVGFEADTGSVSASEPGWGLMTMKEKAEAVRGRLHVESEPGQGARIIVQVPLT
jgi:signal transduction histidine kinase